MKLLLDTHIWLWSLRESHRLSKRLQHELTSSENEMWLSPISVWEALLLHSKRRIQIDRAIEDWVVGATSDFREAPVTHEIVAAAALLPLAHPDPADRFLLATAEVLGLTFVTADQKLLGLGKIATLANR